MARVRLLPATLLVAVAAATAGACGSTNGSGSAAVTPSTPGTTVTATVTTQNPPAPTHSTPPRTTTTTTAASADAATVVSDYFDAINAQDYGRAWALGGKNLDSSYSHFVSGFSATTADVVTILDTTPTTVTLHLDALQSDGTVKSFEGTYTVSDGTITRAGVHAVSGTDSQPTTAPKSPSDTGGAAGQRLYKDCADAHNQNVYDIEKGQPGYELRLDRDHDNIACETNETDAP
jgi:hypothetical protein